MSSSWGEHNTGDRREIGPSPLTTDEHTTENGNGHIEEANTASALTFPEGGTTGWLTVLGSGLALLSTFGITLSNKLDRVRPTVPRLFNGPLGRTAL